MLFRYLFRLVELNTGLKMTKPNRELRLKTPGPSKPKLYGRHAKLLILQHCLLLRSSQKTTHDSGFWFVMYFTKKEFKNNNVLMDLRVKQAASFLGFWFQDSGTCAIFRILKLRFHKVKKSSVLKYKIGKMLTEFPRLLFKNVCKYV